MAMLIQIDPSEERAIYVQIMDEIKRAMVLGTVVPDDPLPSVRQLASDLKVNPNTVKQAYRELEREGRIYTERGRGTFVADHDLRRPERERREMARGVAERAIREAYRNGLSPAELMETIREITSESPAEAGDEDQGVA